MFYYLISMVLGVLLFNFSINSAAIADKSFMVTSCGIAVIVKGDTDLAKNQALENALHLAIEQTVNTIIDSKKALESYQVLNNTIYIKPQEYIQKI